MTSKYRIAEQALLRLKGGYPSVGSSIQIEDLILAAGQVINRLFKSEHLTNTLPNGETIPDGCCFMTFENIPVSSWGKISYSDLPAMPVALHRNMGVYEVCPQDCLDQGYIPLQAGQAALVKSQDLINDLLGQVGYTVYGTRVEYTKDLTALGENFKVMMRLVVASVDNLDEDAPLPIPADMEDVVVNELVKQFAGVPAPDKINDNGSEPTKQ